MFRAHLANSDLDGIYRVYIPGIGTLFPEIGDNGSVSYLGLDTHNGMGAMGQDRLDYAFKEIQRVVTKSESRTKMIEMISISVFGFSRGATLARAFLRDLIDLKKGYGLTRGARIFWQRGNHPMEIRFVGIWDTVAAVGAPTGSTLVTNDRSSLRTQGNWYRKIFLSNVAKALVNRADLKATSLAFGKRGADPTAGLPDGHSAWAKGLEIPGYWISGRCVHMVAAHEQRNCFPLDSVLRGSEGVVNTVEIPYPGMHSDVGGGYRPGEGGKGAAARSGVDNRQEAASKPSQISLRAMYDEALAAGVPVRRIGNSNEWVEENRNDFLTSPVLVDLFDHYMAKAQTAGLPLGDAMLRHMYLYFSWRFQHIHRGGRAKDMRQIAENEKVFAQDAEALRQEYEALTIRRRQLIHERAAARHPQMSQTGSGSLSRADSIDQELEDVEVRMKEVKARSDTLPSHGTLAKSVVRYDEELLDDARCIGAMIVQKPALRAELRPHYRNLIEAYEAEYHENKGLRDEKIIAFFDGHLHDSLADFGKDFTLPSDPRVIYVGGDMKLEYAALTMPYDASDPMRSKTTVV